MMELRKQIEQELTGCLPEGEALVKTLLDSMAYSLTAGGKRVRPLLVLHFAQLCGGSAEAAMPFACAVEMIHTYSLIHDDLPCMDNDDLRRGKPTNHRVFGENIAILAGDGLLNAAAELMASHAVRMDDMRGVRAMEIIMRHAGVTGMIAGQTLDVTSEGKEPEEGLVSRIHRHKTADLLEAAVEAGLVLAGASEDRIAAGRQYAYHLGLAFQMTDDLLDVRGNASMMGKNTGMDANKMTWVALKGVEGTEHDACRENEMAKDALKNLHGHISFFAELADSIAKRRY